MNVESLGVTSGRCTIALLTGQLTLRSYAHRILQDITEKQLLHQQCVVNTGSSMMITVQVKNIESLLQWLKTCPHDYAISSMQGGFVHVKFFISMEELVEQQNAND